MSGFEDDPYLAADRRSHWWQAALVTGGILATLLVALLRHGRDRDRVREAEAIREVERELSGFTPSAPGGWRGPTGEAWSPAGPSRDAPAVELELISVGGRVDITDASVSIAGQDYELRPLPTWTFSSGSFSLAYDPGLRVRATAHGVTVAARASIAEVELVDTDAAPAAWLDARVAAYRDAGVTATAAEAIAVSLLGQRATGRRIVTGGSRVELVAATASRGRMLRAVITGARDADDDAALHAALASVCLRRHRPTPEFELVPMEELVEPPTVDLLFTEEATPAPPRPTPARRAPRPTPIRIGVPVEIGGQTVTIARRKTIRVQRRGLEFEHAASMLLVEGEATTSPLLLHQDDLMIQITTTPGLLTLADLARELGVPDAAAATVEADEFTGLRTSTAATGTTSVTFAFVRDAQAFLVSATAPPDRLPAVLELVTPVMRTLR